MRQATQKIARKVTKATASPWAVPLALLGVAFLVYGLFFSQLGFYWDDLPISWIRYQFGADVMRLYFRTSRPVWGELYQITTRLLPDVPAYWQLFAVFWRWVTALLCWLLLVELWPDRRKLAFTTSMLFLLYPGTTIQWASFLSAHFFIVLSFFLLSFLLMFWSFRPPQWLPVKWPFLILALIFSALNVWMTEYFFFLELIRPFFIFAYLRQDARSQGQSYWMTARRVVPRWLPYLAVWLADVVYRRLVFTNLAYENVLLEDLKTRPITTGLGLPQTIISDLWLMSVRAWSLVFQLPSPAHDGPLTTLFYVFAALAVGGVTILLVQQLHHHDVPRSRRPWLWPVVLGLIALLCAGGPYWLAGLEMSLAFPANRFAMSFLLGASLLLGGLMELLPTRVRLVVTALLVALAAGRQTLWADAFRRDWATQKALFWQMVWRAPGIAPDTVVFLNDGPLNYYADNSLGAALNWIYDPENHTAPIHYVLFYPLTRLGGTLKSMAPGQPIVYTTYWVTAFYGNTSQAVAFYYKPPGCLRLLDPQIDADNRLIPDDSMMRDAAALSSSKWILPKGNARVPEIYGPEPAHGWCYYFEQADLAAQAGDWPRVTQLGDAAFQLDDYPNDPVERFVFIEGYAHQGNWERAQSLAVESYKVSPHYVGPLLCKLFARMDAELAQQSTNRSSLNDLRTKFSCLP
jgi:hypothetical protein